MWTKYEREVCEYCKKIEKVLYDFTIGFKIERGTISLSIDLYKIDYGYGVTAQFPIDSVSVEENLEWHIKTVIRQLTHIMSSTCRRDKVRMGHITIIIKDLIKEINYRFESPFEFVQSDTEGVEEI